MPEWRYDKIDLGGLPRRTSDIDVLNDAGKDGWELVTDTTLGANSGSAPVLLFKRAGAR